MDWIKDQVEEGSPEHTFDEIMLSTGVNIEDDYAILRSLSRSKVVGKHYRGRS